MRDSQFVLLIVVTLPESEHFAPEIWRFCWQEKDPIFQAFLFVNSLAASFQVWVTSQTPLYTPENEGLETKVMKLLEPTR